MTIKNLCKRMIRKNKMTPNKKLLQLHMGHDTIYIAEPEHALSTLQYGILSCKATTFHTEYETVVVHMKKEKD